LALGLEADLILDRRRLKRRLVFWRVLGVVALVALALALIRPGLATRHVARVNISGIITDNQRLLDTIARLRRDRAVPAVIVSIDSPGGSVAGGEALFDALGRLAKAKPVVAVMRGTAASAAYMAALPAARIFAREGTLTGSIGVILEAPEIGGLLARLGASVQVVKSGPLKDQPSLTAPLSPAGQAYLQDLVSNLFGQFVNRVAVARHLDPARVRELADGRAYTGQQALALGLVDEIGGEPEARAWLSRVRHVSAKLPVRDVAAGGFYRRTLGAMMGGLIGAVGDAIPLAPSAMALWR